MTSSNHTDAMSAFSRAWRLEADTIYCRCCKRGVVRSRDTGTFQHRAGCTNKASHPWAVLSAIISTPIATAPKESRIYLSGPMTGLPDLNFPAFHAEAAQLGKRFYAGDFKAVDEFLQLYCIADEDRVRVVAEQGGVS